MDDCKKCFKDTVDAFGGIDGIIANAGWTRFSASAALSLSRTSTELLFQRVIASKMAYSASLRGRIYLGEQSKNLDLFATANQKNVVQATFPGSAHLFFTTPVSKRTQRIWPLLASPWILRKERQAFEATMADQLVLLIGGDTT